MTDVGTYALASRHMEAAAREAGHTATRETPHVFTAGGVVFRRTSSSSLDAIRSTRDKAWCKERFQQANVPTPGEATGYPCIEKPVGGTGGAGVRILTRPTPPRPNTIREELITGTLYRVFVAYGKAVATLRQTPAFVIGDGRSTVAALAALKSRDRPTPTYAPIKVLPSLRDRIPAAGERVECHYLATRGIGADVTQTTNPRVEATAIKAVAAIPALHSGGVDLIQEETSRAVVLEVNSQPHVQAHYAPQAGVRKDPLRHLVLAALAGGRDQYGT